MAQVMAPHIHRCTCLLFILMLWHRRTTFESKLDRSSPSTECRIRTSVSRTESTADCMPTDKPIELSRIKLKTWSQKPVPMISEHSAHSTPLPDGCRAWLWWYTHTEVYIHTNINVHMHAYICIFMHTNIYIYIYTHTNTFALTTINAIILRQIDSNNINDCGAVSLWWLVHHIYIILQITRGNNLPSHSELHQELPWNDWLAPILLKRCIRHSTQMQKLLLNKGGPRIWQIAIIIFRTTWCNFVWNASKT